MDPEERTAETRDDVVDADGRALASVLRLRILRLCLDEALTNKQIADRSGGTLRRPTTTCGGWPSGASSPRSPSGPGPAGPARCPTWRRGSPGGRRSRGARTGCSSRRSSRRSRRRTLDQSHRTARPPARPRRPRADLAALGAAPGVRGPRPGPGGRPWSMFFAVHEDTQRPARALRPRARGSLGRWGQRSRSGRGRRSRGDCRGPRRAWQAAYRGVMPGGVPGRAGRGAPRGGVAAGAGGTSGFLGVLVPVLDGRVVGFAARGLRGRRGGPRGALGDQRAPRLVGAWRGLPCSAPWRGRWPAGHDVAVLWVVPGNTRARAFYERHGWTSDGVERRRRGRRGQRPGAALPRALPGA